MTKSTPGSVYADTRIGPFLNATDMTIPQRALVLKELADAFDSGAIQSQPSKMESILDRFMLEILEAIAGSVCTPERGYKEDGGLNLIVSDVRRLADSHDKLLSAVQAALRIETLWMPSDTTDTEHEDECSALAEMRRLFVDAVSTSDHPE